MKASNDSWLWAEEADREGRMVMGASADRAVVRRREGSRRDVVVKLIVVKINF